MYSGGVYFNLHVQNIYSYKLYTRTYMAVPRWATENKFGNIETQGGRRVICIFWPLFVFKRAHACQAWGNNKEMSLSRRFSKTKEALDSECGNKEMSLNQILQNKEGDKECFELIPHWMTPQSRSYLIFE